MKKKCSKCLIEKDINEFHKHSREKDGRCYECKECRKFKSKLDYISLKLQDKKRVEIKLCSKCLIEKNIDCFHRQIGSKDGYRSSCKECRRLKFNSDYKNILTFSRNHKERSKTYRINNRKKINEYFKIRYINKPHEYAWRGLLSSVIRRIGSKKESSTHETLGYSAIELKKHIENLFTEGMSWNNWGEWHIDHKIPVSKFNKNDDPKVVNSLENLQPMWASENIRKGSNFYGKRI